MSKSNPDRFVSHDDDFEIVSADGWEEAGGDTDIAKDAPSVGDAHIPAPMGGGRKKKKRQQMSGPTATSFAIALQGKMPMAKSFDDIIKGAFAYTPKDGEPKLPIHDAKHVGMAAAALSSGGFRGQKVQIPAGDVASVKAKVRAAWKKFNPDKSEAEMPESIRKDAADGDPVPPKAKKAGAKKKTVPADDSEQTIDDQDESGEEDYTEDVEGDRRDYSTAQKRLDVHMVVKIEKLDAPNKTVYGWASVTSVGGVEMEDLQSDVISVEEIRHAAHDFMTNSRVGGEMHFRKNVGQVVESIVIDAAVKKALGSQSPLEGWFIGYKVTDPQVWQEVESGRYRSFSIGGSGVRVPEED